MFKSFVVRRIRTTVSVVSLTSVRSWTSYLTILRPHRLIFKLRMKTVFIPRGSGEHLTHHFLESTQWMLDIIIKVQKWCSEKRTGNSENKAKSSASRSSGEKRWRLLLGPGSSRELQNLGDAGGSWTLTYHDVSPGYLKGWEQCQWPPGSLHIRCRHTVNCSRQASGCLNIDKGNILSMKDRAAKKTWRCQRK